MNELEAILLGLIQGLTEFLPVSSSGHLTLGKELLGVESRHLVFEVAVHAATVCSTLVALRKEIFKLLLGIFKGQNEDIKYMLYIMVSMFPVFIVGVFFKDYVEAIFGSGLLVVGCMLCITAILLYVSERLTVKQQELKKKAKEIGYKEAFIIGIAQAIAVLPGVSRSGSTIATGLLLGVKKEKIAQFSFLMVIIPILGQSFLDVISGEFSVEASGLRPTVILSGMFAAFISGYFACKWMINLVKNTKLYYFAIYCILIGLVSILISLI